jgi:RNA polymerase sigma-70 factor (ECF subfamily)
MDQPPDHELMLAVREGDLPQLGRLFDRHARRLFNFFLRLTFDREASEDLVQETFRRLLEARHTYRDDSRFLAWMFAIARSRHSDFHRRQGRREYVALSEGIADAGRRPDADLEQRREEALLWEALAQLPIEQREALLLSRFEHLKYGEIARIAGCPIGTIKARVHYALRDLSRIFREQGYEVR